MHEIIVLKAPAPGKLNFRELLKHPYNCERRTKSPQTPTPETLQPAPEIRNRRGLFMVAFPFAGQGTRPPVRCEDERKWGCQDSNREPCIPGLGWCSGVKGVASMCLRGTGRRGQVGTPRPRASGVGSAGVAGLGAFRGSMVFPTLGDTHWTVGRPGPPQRGRHFNLKFGRPLADSRSPVQTVTPA